LGVSKKFYGGEHPPVVGVDNSLACTRGRIQDSWTWIRAILGWIALGGTTVTPFLISGA